MAPGRSRLPLLGVLASVAVVAWQTPGLGFAAPTRRAQAAGRCAAPTAAARLGASCEPQQASGWAASAGVALAAAAVAAASCRLAGSERSRARIGHIARNAGPALMPWKIPNTTQYQWLSVRELLLRERILMVNSYLDEQYANANLSMLLYLQSEDAKKPVSIYYAVPGAMLKPALALYDTVEQLKGRGCKITTVSYSLNNGMGAFLAGAGTKGRRFATPNSLFRLSKTGLENSFQGQASDIMVEAQQMLRESNRVEEELAKMTGRSMEQIQKDLRRDFYLSAEQAKEYGLIDRLLQPDTEKGKRLNEGQRDPWSGQVTRQKVGFGEFADPDQPRTATDAKRAIE